MSKEAITLRLETILLGARTLLGAPGIATRSKKLLAEKKHHYPKNLDSQSFRRLVTINFQIALGAMKHMDRLRLSQTVSRSVSFWAALLGVITTLAGLRLLVPQKQRRRSPGKRFSN